MSKLSDKIRKALRLEATPIGFRAIAPLRNPPLVVVLKLEGNDPIRVTTAVEKGADSVLLQLDKVDAEAIKAAIEAAADSSLGVWMEAPDRETVADLVANGVDYVVFDASKTPASTLLEEKAGFVLALPAATSDTQLRSVELVHLDAVLLPPVKESLTVQGQMDLRRLAVLTRKPLMAPVPASLKTADLECLRDSGVLLVLIDGDEEGALDALPALRGEIEQVPPPRRRREERGGAVLPRPEIAVEEGEEEEEEEEEDED